MNWKQETLEDGREVWQLHVQIDRLEVSYSLDSAAWYFEALDADGNSRACVSGFVTKRSAKLAAAWWVRQRGITIYAETEKEVLRL